MTDNNIKARVEAGMAWLDEHHPGWERRIDLASLNLSSGCYCVLGQALGHLAEQAGVTCGFSAGRREMQDNNLRPAFFGFDIFDNDDIFGIESWEPLEAEWRDAIKRRFDTGVLSDDVVRPA